MSTYKLITHTQKNIARAGIYVDGLVYDAADVLERSDYSSVIGILNDWTRAQVLLSDFANWPDSRMETLKSLPIDKALLMAPIPIPGGIYCAGANYSDHMAEMAAASGRPLRPSMKDLGDIPWHFLKAPRSTVVGPLARVPLPKFSKMVDWEIELAVVIGKTAKDVPVESALDYVAGYTIANDLSARDAMKREKSPPTSPMYMDWLSHKSFDGACPLGPWIVPAAQIPNPEDLALQLWVNGELMQDSNTSNLIFGVAEQIAALSSRLTLHPGDLILTGTPAGVGMGRNKFLKSGDVVRLWIEKIGEMTHSML